MRRIVLAGVLALLTLVPFGKGAPVEGPSGASRIVPAGTGTKDNITEPGSLQYQKAFRAGERACVIVIGDHDPIVDVEVKVYDAKDNLVAQDRGKDPAPDFVAVMWYPPREQTYRIVVNSYGSVENKCYVAFK
jgi:hypothetical protein